MIVKLRLSARKPFYLPKSYNRVLQAFFYANVEPGFARFLHDHGYKLGKRSFKLFTFSRLLGKILQREPVRLIFAPSLELYFATPLLEVLKASAGGLLTGSPRLGETSLSLESLELVERAEEKAVFKPPRRDLLRPLY
ncbi:MAG: hypothetical protein GXO03_03605 [Aquificae bacterium]|nr:hypothetical protein [Aquificota bacterium]